MAQTTGTVYVKIMADTSGLRAALDNCPKPKPPDRMGRFNHEMRHIQSVYRLAKDTGLPVWEAASKVHRRRYRSYPWMVAPMCAAAVAVNIASLDRRLRRVLL